MTTETHKGTKRLACWHGETEVWPEPGLYVKPDLWRTGAKLEACTDYNGADFRLHCPDCNVDLAVNVEITGNKAHESGGVDRVRVRLTFPTGTEEPAATASAWMSLAS